MNDKYILHGHDPVPCFDLLTWGKWFETANRHVADDKLPNGIRVSTVFLGLDHRFDDEGPPLLFETMIFGHEGDEYQERCSTWEQAEAQHAQALAYAKTRKAAA